MNNAEINMVEKLCKDAWINSFFIKRNTDITRFSDWWDIQKSKLVEHEKQFKAGIRMMLNSTVGIKDMSIEAGAQRYQEYCNDPLLPDDPMDISLRKTSFIAGANSEEARQYWMHQFIKEKYLNN